MILNKFVIFIVAALFTMSGGSTNDRSFPQIETAGTSHILVLWNNPPANFQSMAGEVFVKYPDGEVVRTPMKFLRSYGESAAFVTIGRPYRIWDTGKYTVTDGTIGGEKIRGLPTSFCVPQNCGEPYPPPPYPGP